MRPDVFREAWVNVFGKEIGGILLRFPNLEHAPDPVGDARAVRDESLRRAKDRFESREHRVVAFLGLSGNIRRYEHSHRSTSSLHASQHTARGNLAPQVSSHHIRSSAEIREFG